MRLAFVTDNGFSKKKGIFYYSGANIQHYSIVTKYFEDIVFVARNNAYEPSGNQISDKYLVYLLDSINSNIKIIQNFKKIKRVLESVIKESDIVMCFGINGYFAYRISKKYNKPVIAYVGGCVYEILINMDSYFKKISAPILRFMIRDSVRNANFVHYVDKNLVNKYPTNGKYLVCSNVKIDYEEEALKYRIEKVLKMEKITIGIIGYTYNKIKGIDTAIKALKVLNNRYKLQIVGRGDHTWLNILAKKNNVENRVEFLGILPGGKIVFNWLDSIDIYIQPSLTEGMPRATIEAMSRGCPVISSNVGGLKNLINRNYQISTNNYMELALKIKKLSQSKNEMIEEATRNFKKAKYFNSELLDRKRDAFYNMIRKEIDSDK